MRRSIDDVLILARLRLLRWGDRFFDRWGVIRVRVCEGDRLYGIGLCQTLMGRVLSENHPHLPHIDQYLTVHLEY
jgi:hypothetical protein